MTDTTPVDLDQIRARHTAATPGPWTADNTDLTWTLHAANGLAQILKAPKAGTPYAEYWPNPADAAFLVGAHADVAALLARVDELETALADGGPHVSLHAHAEYRIQAEQPDGTWESISSPISNYANALIRAARSRQHRAGLTLRLVRIITRRTTTVVDENAALARKITAAATEETQ